MKLWKKLEKRYYLRKQIRTKKFIVNTEKICIIAKNIYKIMENVNSALIKKEDELKVPKNRNKKEKESKKKLIVQNLFLII